MRNLSYPLILAFFLLGCQSNSENTERTETIAKVIFPLKEIAGRTKGEVDKKLGEGTFVSNWKDKRAGCTKCPKYTYKVDSVEVIYINKKADRITLNNLSEYDYNESFVTLLGLPAAKPDFDNGTVMRWYNYENFREIIISENGHAGISFVLVLTKAE